MKSWVNFFSKKLGKYEKFRKKTIFSVNKKCGKTKNLGSNFHESVENKKSVVFTQLFLNISLKKCGNYEKFFRASREKCGVYPTFFRASRGKCGNHFSWTQLFIFTQLLPFSIKNIWKVENLLSFPPRYQFKWGPIDMEIMITLCEEPKIWLKISIFGHFG